MEFSREERGGERVPHHGGVGPAGNPSGKEPRKTLCIYRVTSPQTGAGRLSEQPLILPTLTAFCLTSDAYRGAGHPIIFRNHTKNSVWSMPVTAVRWIGDFNHRIPGLRFLKSPIHRIQKITGDSPNTGDTPITGNTRITVTKKPRRFATLRRHAGITETSTLRHTTPRS